jgi:hypothetical protein
MRRRSVIIAATGLAALAIGYVIYWFLLARTIEQDILAWTAQRRAEGYAISYAQSPIGGFPLSVTVRFRDPDLAPPGGSWRWQGAETRLRVLPWAPYELQFSAPGHHRLSIAGKIAHDISIESRWVSLDLHLKGGIVPDRFALSLLDASVEDSRAGTTTIERLASEARLPWPPARDPSKSNLDLLAGASGVRLPEAVKAPLGREVPTVHLAAQIMGAVPDAAAPRLALLAWSAGGGDVELRQLELSWGPLWAKGDGTLAFDTAMQPLFAGSVAVAGLGSVLDRLAQAGLVQSQSAGMAKLMFAALAAPPPEGGAPQVKLPLTVQDGYVYTGPIRLAPLRPLDWSWLP